jgi:hypothetical protein
MLSEIVFRQLIDFFYDSVTLIQMERFELASDIDKEKVLNTLLMAILVVLGACRTSEEAVSSSKAEFAPNGIPINWGSLQPMAAAPVTVEAKLANAAAKRLNEASQLKDLILGLPPQVALLDGIVSVPPWRAISPIVFL